MRIGHFPRALKLAKKFPLKKQGKDVTDMNSYRQISNLSVIENVLEQAMKIQLEEYFKNNNLITKGNHSGRQAISNKYD